MIRWLDAAATRTNADAAPFAVTYFLMLATALLFCGCAPGTAALKPTGLEYHGPIVSPSGRWLVAGVVDYGRQRHFLRLMTPDGNDEREIAGISASSVPGYWSPDGRLLFEQYGGGPRVAILNPEGAEIKQLARGRNPEWAPDHVGVIWFECTKAFKDCIQGRVMLQPTSGAAPHLLADDARRVWWSPDGRWIAFQRMSEQAACGDGHCESFTTYLRAAEDESSCPIFVGTPIGWSPDGSTLFYVPQVHNRRLSEVRQYDVANDLHASFAQYSVKLPQDNGTRHWRGDGLQIAITLNNPDGIVVLDRKGNVAREFRPSCELGTTCVEIDGELSWSADDSEVLFAARQTITKGERLGGLYALDIARGSIRTIKPDRFIWRSLDRNGDAP